MAVDILSSSDVCGCSCSSRSHNPGHCLGQWNCLHTLFYGLEEDNKLGALAEEKELVRVAKATYKQMRFGNSHAGWRILEDKRQ
jgi:hypothetical protein